MRQALVQLGMHGTSPHSFLNFAGDTKVPAAFRVALSLIGLGSQKVGATVGKTAAPDKRRQLRGKKGGCADGLND
jgi:hypothetical protein